MCHVHCIYHTKMRFPGFWSSIRTTILAKTLMPVQQDRHGAVVPPLPPANPPPPQQQQQYFTPKTRPDPKHGAPSSRSTSRSSPIYGTVKHNAILRIANTSKVQHNAMQNTWLPRRRSGWWRHRHLTSCTSVVSSAAGSPDTAWASAISCCIFSSAACTRNARMMRVEETQAGTRARRGKK